jgi:hypothetical protein
MFRRDNLRKDDGKMMSNMSRQLKKLRSGEILKSKRAKDLLAAAENSESSKPLAKPV